MSRAKRPITLLEGFLLAILTSRDEVTFYSLKRDFGLNPGGIAHALRALAARGLVSRSGGSGRSHAYRITAAGDEAVRTQWKEVLAGANLDFESTGRAVWLATTMDLSSAPSRLRPLADRLPQAGSRTASRRAANDGTSIDQFYLKIRQTILQHERRALADAINHLADIIEEGTEP